MSKQAEAISEKDSKTKPLTPPTNALDEILAWSKTLPDWQSDAVRRILQQHELTAEDFKQIFEMFKVAHNLLKKSETTPKRLSEKDVPTYSGKSSKVILEAMREFKGVNAIVPGQTLKFHATGMTIIYGHNASGKSGYARVLKKACRARGEKESVLPNVFVATPTPSLAQALIDIHDGSKSTPILWKEGSDGPDILSSINVFDSRCARVFIDGTNEVAYVPYGLDVFDKLSKLIEKLKAALQAEGDAINADPNQFADLRGDTVVGKLIGALSHETTVKNIDDCAEIKPEDQKKLDDLEKKLAELKINDPKVKAESLRIKKRRVERLAAHVSSVDLAISLVSIADIQKSEQELVAAENASEIASKNSFSEEPLGGVTSEPWKLLFNAAKEYSERYAYPSEIFPVIKIGARCVFCFQELSADGADRLKRFQEFVQNKTQQILNAAQKKQNSKIKTTNDLTVSPFLSDPELEKEITEIDINVAIALKAYIKDVEVLHAHIKEAMKSRKWEKSYTLPRSPFAALNGVASGLEVQAKGFDDMAGPQEKIKLEKEFSELDGRRRLAVKKINVVSFVEKLCLKEKIKVSIRATNTIGISRKSTELMELLITEKLKRNLKTEFESLNVGYIKMDLNKSGSKGVTFHKLKLQSSSHPNVNLSDVLSEGEQRAIAIAAFLGELKTFPNNQGIVFDDPVSSLDHIRRERVAQRLAEEAKNRQVIIFTHDLVFLIALQTACESREVDHVIQTLWGNSSGTGYCDPNAPWDGQNIKKRIGYLKGHVLPKIKTIHGQPSEREDYERRVDDFYKKLRQSWERTIEEVVFNDAIQRFRDSVETNKLKGVRFEDDDFKVINENMAKCSKFLHDRAAGKGGVLIPEPIELETDLERIERFTTSIRKRNEETSNNR